MGQHNALLTSMVYLLSFFWSDDKKTLYNEWVALIGKKLRRFYQRRIDQNSHHDRNILRTKDGKRKTTKGVPGCHWYHETCRWNNRWCPCQVLCSLQKQDQRVIQQQNLMAPKGNKITWHHKLWRKCPSCSPGPGCLPCGQSPITFQSLKYH